MNYFIDTDPLFKYFFKKICFSISFFKSTMIFEDQMPPGANQNRPAGYSFLIEKYRLTVLPNWHSSSVSQRGSLRTTIKGASADSVYPPSYWPGDTTGDHLEFALKYDGINLGILSALFEAITKDEITAWIKSKPTGKYARKIWFLYEFLTDTELALPDLTMGNYIPVLEPDSYIVAEPGLREKRHKIINNLLGGPFFCPTVRRTKKVSSAVAENLLERCEKVTRAYPPDLLRRAMSYLYTKETKSSFEIEHIKPSASRTAKFIGLLEMAGHRDFCDESLLIDVQNRIVDPRFREKTYRSNQNYVGQTVSFQKQLVHYVCPKPEDIPSLMAGLLTSHQIMKDGAVPEQIHAAAISYGFVFLHPFEDGNGRIHRFLIHNILSLRGAVPKGLIFPISAAMLKNPELYDQSLEAFSNPLMRLIEYGLDEAGHMKVAGETSRFYRYLDMTPQAEALRDFVELTIERELVEELDFLARYDRTRQAIQEAVDLPDRLIDLFIRLCLQNKGRLSEKKRRLHFGFLNAEELERMEDAVRQGYGVE